MRWRRSTASRRAGATDILFSPKGTVTQGKQLAKLTRFYDPMTLLKQATGTNGELLALSGERNPYPQPLGRIAPGAFADLLVADGDPTVNLDFLSNPGTEPAPDHEGWQGLQDTL